MDLSEFRDFTKDLDDDVELWIVKNVETGEHTGLGDISYEVHTTNGRNLMLEPRKKS